MYVDVPMPEYSESVGNSRGRSFVGLALPCVCSRTVSARSEQEMKSTVGIANRKRIIKGIRSLQNQGGAEHPRMAPRMNDNCLPGELPHPPAPFA